MWDERGALMPIELDGLAVVRVFVVEAPDGAVRGGHGHASGKQLLVRLSGRIDIETRLAGDIHSFTLDDSDHAVLIASPVWSTQTYRGDGARLLVLCDTPYDPSTYINER